MEDDVRWLLSYEDFDGYQFDGILSNDFGHKTLAPIVRRLVQDESFCRPIVDSVLTDYSAWQELAPKTKAELQARPNGFRALARIQTSPRRYFARAVETLVTDALQARELFDRLPKRTPSEHKKFFLHVASLARDLRVAVKGDPYHLEFPSWDTEDDLRRIEELASDIANDAVPLARPNSMNAKRTYVARTVSQSFRRRTGQLRHAAAASLVNAVFSNHDPVDAVYMQTLARGLPDD